MLPIDSKKPTTPSIKASKSPDMNSKMPSQLPEKSTVPECPPSAAIRNKVGISSMPAKRIYIKTPIIVNADTLFISLIKRCFCFRSSIFAPLLITPSSAAVFKLWFYGILLRSKTIKLRLKNCPVQRSGTVLQRLVRNSFLGTMLKNPNIPCFQHFLYCNTA